MQWVPPELREGQDEIVRALAGMLPELVTDADIKGILHAHTERSDGADTLATMVEATLARGYEYFGVADHSKSAHYAGGLNAAQVAEQQAEAERLNKKYGRAFRVFKGIEFRYSCGRIARFSGRGAEVIRLCGCQRAWAFQT